MLLGVFLYNMMPNSGFPALTLNRRSNCGIRSYYEQDSTYICNWVRSRHLLSLISGDNSCSLVPSILRQWIDYAYLTFVYTQIEHDIPIAFCSLSNIESKHIPHDSFEICHFIVDPHRQSMGIGTELLNHVIKIALGEGFRKIYWRVNPYNKIAIKWCGPPFSVEINQLDTWMDNSCRWFTYKNNSSGFRIHPMRNNYASE